MECSKRRAARISKTQRSSDMLHSAINKWLCRNRRYRNSLKLLKKKPNHNKTKPSCMWQLWNLIVTYHAKDFPNLVTLAQLGLTLAVHTAGCERGFSVQNNILTPSRNRLTPVVQQKLIRVKLGPERVSFNFQAALLKWRAVKDRRIYELKKTNPKI